MKKFLFLFIVIIACSNSAFGKDLTGSKLKCELAGMEQYIEFTSYNEIVIWDFYPMFIKFYKKNYYYDVDVKEINIYYYPDFKNVDKYPSSINRETLKFGSYVCDLTSIADIEKYLYEQLNILTEEQLKKNKL